MVVLPAVIQGLFVGIEPAAERWSGLVWHKRSEAQTFEILVLWDIIRNRPEQHLHPDSVEVVQEVFSVRIISARL